MSELVENTLSPVAFDVAIVKTGKLWPDDFLAEMKAIMETHGGNVMEHSDHLLWYFPPKTIKRQIFPVITMDRWKIILPDGFEMRMRELPAGGYILIFPDDAFSQEIQTKYAK